MVSFLEQGHASIIHGNVNWTGEYNFIHENCSLMNCIDCARWRELSITYAGGIVIQGCVCHLTNYLSSVASSVYITVTWYFSFYMVYVLLQRSFINVH